MANDTPSWKASLKRSFPHIILVVVYVSYLIAGGVIFHAIESGTSEPGNGTDVSSSKSIMEDISALVASCSNDEGDQEQVEMLMKALIQSVDPWWSEEGEEALNSGNEWTFWTAALFCMTTVTTIGYGTITPATGTGKLVAVLYSLIGLPLSVLFVVDMGGLMAQSTSNLTWHVRRRCRRKKRPNRFEPFVNEGETDENARPINLHELSSEEEEEDGYGGGGGGHSGGMTTRRNGQVSRRIVISTDQPSYLANLVEPSHDTDGTVPMVIVVCLLFCYICFGAIIFSLSEGWPFLDAFYFTFVTLTTIGYGDLYPVKHMAHNTMLPVTVYILLGLCWVAMCVWLVVGRVWRFVKAIESKLLAIVGIK